MKLIVSDFDLTFFDENYDNNIKLINDFTKKGNKFVIATGRFYKLLQGSIENKNINYDYLICTSGAIILDRNLNIIHSIYIEENLASEIIDILNNSSIISKLYIDELNGQIYGIYAVYNSIDKAKELLNSIVSKYSINGYISTHGLNFVSSKIDKVAGIKVIQEKLKIPSSDIYVIGDSNNDVEMIKEYSGYSIKGNIKEGIKVENFKEFMELINESNIN